ncbi:MAG: type IV pilus modification protein PilV [Burkholderiales bacterium]|nr:type IV pilus modification protein PilV [Burkholderiales bacterium]
MPSSTAAATRAQRGFMMLEALIAILIFSLGILAIIGLQAQSVRNSAEAKYRADASFLANQIIGRMWANRGALASYAYNANGTCTSAGSAPTFADVTSWAANVSTLLPDAPATRQSITVANDRTVTVRICWTSPTGPHNMLVTTRISN